MRILLNEKGLSAPGVSDAAKCAHLFKAIAFNLAMPALFAGIAGENLAHAGASALGGHKSAVIRVDGSRIETGINEKSVEAALRQKYATTDQNPNLTDVTQASISWFHSNMPELDNGWRALFDPIDLRGSAQDSFDIRTTAAGITWEQREEGAPAKIRRAFTGDKITVEAVEYAAGLGILDRWLQFNKFWNVSEAVGEFMATANDKLAEIHYGLLTAIATGGTRNIAFATDDATTFNNAGANILRALRGQGMAVGANAQFDIVVNPEKAGRILAMLDAQRGSPIVAYGTQDQPLAFSVRNVVVTTHVPSNATGYYLVLPGRKLKSGNWMDLSIESKRDIAVSAEDWVGRQQFNAVIGNTSQFAHVLYT